jgi:hypothetical protein
MVTHPHVFLFKINGLFGKWHSIHIVILFFCQLLSQWARVAVGWALTSKDSMPGSAFAPGLEAVGKLREYVSIEGKNLDFREFSLRIWRSYSIKVKFLPSQHAIHEGLKVSAQEGVHIPCW